MLLIPRRGDNVDEAALPGDCRRILAIVRAAGGPVQVPAVVEELGLQVEVREKLEPLRAKLVKLADRGWPHERAPAPASRSCAAKTCPTDWWPWAAPR
ncbi:hypothetical protein POF50_011155 [Streptomyces sp. SL13]|uniref:Uncharacterized protein n=1 Tax=Streptantibioticus silvisoli TaxID=2705255 RepID=A0AA90H223_9ACTN|nr:hypothetical protein [Streptantibioticus silvisoli]MDI5969886.1 hypothetical protein [Streptantibioticus silvisoli]